MKLSAEIAVKPSCCLPIDEIHGMFEKELNDGHPPSSLSNDAYDLLPANLQEFTDKCKIYEELVQSPSSSSSAKSENGSSMKPAAVTVFPYRLNRDDPFEERIGEGDDAAVGMTVTELPNSHLEDVWESLYFDDDIKSKVLSYAETMIKLSLSAVDQSLISFNRVILLNGPAGTGKTSLCKAVAQKLAIRNNPLNSPFTNFVLIQINSHSLFSKWFSESGKLVEQVFEKIELYLHDEKCLVSILIDEVESLSGDRTDALARGEPGDAVRAVNAVLTRLDALKSYSNLLVMSTSNIVRGVDPAFLDRVDLNQTLPLPTIRATELILQSSLIELEKKKIIECATQASDNDNIQKIAIDKEILLKCEGLSGRSLRKLPLIALSLCSKVWPVPRREFLQALGEAAVSRKASE